MRKILLPVFFIFVLFGCSDEKLTDPLYEGRVLTIGVVGEFPKVRETNIQFKQMTFENWKVEETYDAVFISEEYLPEASNIENVQKFKESDVPVFFLNTRAFHIPFIEMENPQSYEETAKQINSTEDPIAGIFYVDEVNGYKGWTFGYPIKDSQMQTSDIESVYSQVFKVIEEF